MPHLTTHVPTVLAVRIYVVLTSDTERVNGSSVVTEEMPTDEFMSDMLPVDQRHPLDDDAGPVAAADNDDDHDLAHSQNGKKVFLPFLFCCHLTNKDVYNVPVFAYFVF